MGRRAPRSDALGVRLAHGLGIGVGVGVGVKYEVEVRVSHGLGLRLDYGLVGGRDRIQGN